MSIENRGKHEALWHNRWQILKTMHSAIHISRDDGVLKFLNEDALTANDRQGRLLVTVSLGRDYRHFTVQVGMAALKPVDYQIGLIDCQRAAARANAQYARPRWGHRSLEIHQLITS
jgi:hypothetical protein